jgi:phosphoglycerate dehydrogenase-like enzyme
MARPKLTVLIEPALRDALLFPESLAALHGMCDVRLYAEPTQPKNAPLSGYATLLRDAQILLTSWGAPPVDEAFLAAAPKLEVIVYLAGTVKAFATDAMWDRGVRVCSCARAIGDSVAEFVVGLMISARRDTFRLARAMRENRPANNGMPTIHELWRSTVGIVSLGNIGKRVCELLRGFDVPEVLVYDPYVSEEVAASYDATRVELDDLLSRSDIVTLHAPNLPATKHIIDARRLSLMKDDAILINTARGDLIDEAALIGELRKGRLFACLDVTSPEPALPDSPLRSLPNVLLTPHVAGPRSRRIGEQAVEEVRRYLAGQPQVYEMTRERLAVTA